MIAIVDLGLGNVASVSRALKFLRLQAVITNRAAEIEAADKIVLPGVGSFQEAARRLEASGLASTIRAQATVAKKPLLGICLGMQLLAEKGAEGGSSRGLGLIPGKVARLRSEAFNCRLPHVGWNNLLPNGMRLFSNLPPEPCFYFVHSFEFVCDPVPGVESASANYGVDFVAAVKKDNVVGVQFHPEKSQKAGLQVLRNFVEGNY